MIIQMTTEDRKIEEKLTNVSAIAGDLEFPAMLDDHIADYGICKQMLRLRDCMPAAERLGYLFYQTTSQELENL